MNTETFFKNFWGYPSGPRYSNSVRLDKNAFSAYLEVDIDRDNIEIPTVVMPFYNDIIDNGYERIAYNLSSGYGRRREESFRQKTMTAILSRFADASGYERMRMAKVLTMKDVCYYGTNGIILDGDFNPLVIATVQLHKHDDGHVLFCNPKFLVSYRVFENSSELIEHAIIKQVIPMYHNDCVFLGGQDPNDWHSELVDVVIDDFDYMVKKPSLTSMEKLSQESINRIIYDNI